jgi:hypothetical protein
MRFRTVVIVLLILAGAGYAVHRLVFTSETPRYTDPDERFKYGSIGSEPGGSILAPVGGLLPPYKVFRILPAICPDLLSEGISGSRELGSEREYRSIGLIYERDRDGRWKDLPIGISRRRRFRLQMLGVNCALCHVGSVRDAPDSTPRILPGMPPQQPDVQRLVRFLFDCIQDPRFTADRVIQELNARKDAKLATGFLERLAYRWFVLPKLKTQIRSRARDLDGLVEGAFSTSGPGRLDTVNPGKILEVKEPLENLPIAELRGSADFPHVWELSERKRERTRLHWDGNLGSVEETILSAALVVGAKPNTLDPAGFKAVKEYVTGLLKPPYLYESNSPLVERGRPIFARYCAECHVKGGKKTGQVTPLEIVGTDPFRVQAFTLEFAEKLPRALNRHYAGSMFQFRTFQKTNGYVNVPLDGIWARGPYLHNGSVPSLRDLLEPEKCRPPRFYRGSDVFDRTNVGFMSYPERPGPDQNCPARADRPASSPPPNRGPDEPELFLFDTSIAGNHNTGHLWGTKLSDDDKRALVEYLKTL